MKSRKWLLVCLITGFICLLLGAGAGWLGYHQLYRPEIILSTRAEATARMVEKVIYYDDGEQRTIDIKSEVGIGMVSLLTRKLHELNSQAKCIFSSL